MSDQLSPEERAKRIALNVRLAAALVGASEDVLKVIRGCHNAIQVEVQDAEKQARAEVLAACIKHQCSFCRDGHVPIEEDGTWLHRVKESGAVVTCDAARLRNLQPAASDLEALRSRSYRDGATGAAVWFVKLLHGHPEDPPQMGCKPEAIGEKLEALLREAELEMLERIRTDEGGVYVYCPERENTEGPAIIRLDVFIRVKKRQIAELEKARAIEKELQ